MDEIMDNVEKRGFEKGYAEGYAENFAKSIKRGENKLALLMRILLAANRFEDADKATTDKIRRNQLYEEFGIQ